MQSRDHRLHQALAKKGQYGLGPDRRQRHAKCYLRSLRIPEKDAEWEYLRPHSSPCLAFTLSAKCGLVAARDVLAGHACGGWRIQFVVGIDSQQFNKCFAFVWRSTMVAPPGPASDMFFLTFCSPGPPNNTPRAFPSHSRPFQEKS